MGARGGIRAIALAGAALAASCGTGDGPTEIVVIAESDLAIPAVIDAVRFEVDASALGEERHVVRAPLVQQGDLPASVVLFHEGGPLGPIEVDVIGEAAGTDRIRVRTATEFVPGRSITLRVELLAACIGRSCETPHDAGPEPMVDGGVIPPADAGPMCPAECEGTCDPGCMGTACDCRKNCACDLVCEGTTRCEPLCDDRSLCTVVGMAGADTKANCEGGAVCSIDARDGRQVEVHCMDSSCEIDCRGTDDCKVRCNSRSTCLLSCGGDGACRYEECGRPQSCSGGVIACNRGCPE